jgi:hypothetical protein
VWSEVRNPLAAHHREDGHRGLHEEEQELMPLNDVSGTWLLTVSVFTNGKESPPTHAIITFTRDGGLIERAEPTVFVAVGAWKRSRNEERDDESSDRFDFTFFRFIQDLEVAAVPGPVSQKFGFMERMCSIGNHVHADGTFSGTGKLDWLQADGQTAFVPPPGLVLPSSSRHAGKRMPLVPCDQFPYWPVPMPAAG